LGTTKRFQSRLFSNPELKQLREQLRTFGEGEVRLEETKNKLLVTLSIRNPNKRNALSGTHLFLFSFSFWLQFTHLKAGKMMAELGEAVEQLETWNGACLLIHVRTKRSLFCFFFH
jgi:hypothetical protein